MTRDAEELLALAGPRVDTAAALQLLDGALGEVPSVTAKTIKRRKAAAMVCLCVAATV